PGPPFARGISAAAATQLSLQGEIRVSVSLCRERKQQVRYPASARPAAEGYAVRRVSSGAESGVPHCLVSFAGHDRRQRTLKEPRATVRQWREAKLLRQGRRHCLPPPA